MTGMDDTSLNPLDALTTAPDFHRVLLENDAVRVLDTVVRPGDTVPLHTHRWPAVLYVLSWSDFVRKDADGLTMMHSRGYPQLKPGTAAWCGPLPPHTLENVGEQDLRIIAVEQKLAAAQ